MIETSYRKLVGRLQALAPMCNFGRPRMFCDEKELYFRGLHDRTDEEIRSLVNLESGVSDD